MAAIQDITVNITGGSLTLGSQSSTTLIIGSGAAEIALTTINQSNYVTELANAGYVSTDKEYIAVQEYFTPTPENLNLADQVKVYRKATATSYTDALNALILIDQDWWGFCTTSVDKTENLECGTWANLQSDPPHFFLGNVNDVTTGSGRASIREAYVIYDQLENSGYQEIDSTLTKFIGTAEAGLSAATYDLDITIDGGTLRQLSVVVSGTTDTWADIAADLETELQSATGSTETVEVTSAGKIKVTSATTGPTSTVLIAAGTAGSGDGDLLAAIDNLADYNTSIDDAVDGTYKFPAVAWMGRKIPNEPYKQWKWKVLRSASDLPAVNYTLTQLNTIRDNNTATLTEDQGQVFTNAGETTNDTQYIDMTYGNDFIKIGLKTRLLSLFINNESIPFTNAGFAQIEGEIRSELRTWAKLGYIAAIDEQSSDDDRAKSDNGEYMFKVNVPNRSDIPVSDRQSRVLKYFTFSYTISGAVDEVEVNGYFEV